MSVANGLSSRIRVLLLLLLLVAAPVATAADPSSETSWLDAITQWFETLLDDEEDPPEDGGVIHIPGG